MEFVVCRRSYTVCRNESIEQSSAGRGSFGNNRRAFSKWGTIMKSKIDLEICFSSGAGAEVAMRVSAGVCDGVSRDGP